MDQNIVILGNHIMRITMMFLELLQMLHFEKKLKSLLLSKKSNIIHPMEMLFEFKDVYRFFIGSHPNVDNIIIDARKVLINKENHKIPYLPLSQFLHPILPRKIQSLNKLVDYKYARQ